MRKQLHSEAKFDNAMAGRYVCNVAAAIVGSAVVGAAASSSASSKASKAQGRAADAASQSQLTASRETNALQKEMFDQNRADALPWKNVGEGALNQLAWKMGITPASNMGDGNSRLNLNAQPIEDASRFDGAAYLAAYPDVASSEYYRDKPYQHYLNWGKSEGRKAGYPANGGVGEFDGAAYLAANPDVASNEYYKDKPLQHYLNWGKAEGRKATYKQAAIGQAASDTGYQGAPSDFGSLSRNFTMADRDADPVYQSGLQFGLDQGVQGLERQAAASGSQLSGATLKALARYGNDYGTTKAQGAYERFNNNQTTQYNRLAGISGTGQQQVNQIGAAGQSYANSVGANTMNTANNIANNTIGAGNARAGSYMATANAFNNAIGTGINAWQQNRYLNSLGSNNMTSYGTIPGSQQSNMLAAQW